MPGTAENLYQDLLTALEEFEAFVEDDVNKTALKAAYGALVQMFPQLGPAMTNLEGLLGRVRDEVEDFDPESFSAFTPVTVLAQSVSTLLGSAKPLVPSEAETIDDINDALSVVGGLPGVTLELKGKIVTAITNILGYLAEIRS